MMTTPNKPVTEIIDATTGLLAEPGGLETMELLVNDLPEIDADDAVERILADLLAARTAADLNKPWEATGVEAFVGVPLNILEVGRAPSDYDGIGVYLVVRAMNIRTHEPVVFTTGATMIMGALIMCHRNGWLPIIATPRTGKRKTRKGHDTYHLEFDNAVRID